MRQGVSVAMEPPIAHGNQHDLVRDRYRGYAPHYDRSYRRYTAWSRAHIMDAIADLQPTRILDVCCGTGVVTAALIDRFPAAEVIGADISQEMLARARERLDALGLGGGQRGGQMRDDQRPSVRLVESPAERLPFETGSIELVVCANAFHLFEKSHSAMAEFARVLAPGGRVVILDWTRESTAMRVLARWLNLTQKTRRQLQSRTSLARLGQQVGLGTESAQLVQIPPMWGLMVWRGVKPAT